MDGRRRIVLARNQAVEFAVDQLLLRAEMPLEILERFQIGRAVYGRNGSA
ncbi:MAG: hypothetical protein ACKV22_02380 [Bryobacteraceae bacterium]